MANKYTYSVPFTEEELVRDYYDLCMTQDEIAAKYGTTQKVVWRAMKKMGLKTRKRIKRNQRGAANSTWKGGRVLCSTQPRQRKERAAYGNGYYYLRVPDHPNANKSGYVAEHTLVLTQKLGRALQRGEMVHHINLNKHDNRLENLALTNAKQHSLWHNQLEEIAVSFLLEGLVTFDPEHGYRRIAPTKQ